MFVYFYSSLINSNDAKEIGGAIRTEIGSKVCIEDSRFKGNKAASRGGGIYSRGELELINDVFEENEANVVRAIGCLYCG